MNIEKKYQEVIELLKKGKRPLLPLSDKEREHLNNFWTQVNEEKQFTRLLELLCILDNTKELDLRFKKNIYNSLKNCDDPEILVLILGVSRRQIIDATKRRSERLDFEFLEILKTLLSSKSLEVLEWSLRIIESIGTQSIILKDEIIKNKPSFIKSFNSHGKNAKQIIELLENRFKRK